MCALSSKGRNPAFAGFVARMTTAGKPPKVILLAVARNLLVFAHAIIRTQKGFALASPSGTAELRNVDLPPALVANDN